MPGVRSALKGRQLGSSMEGRRRAEGLGLQHFSLMSDAEPVQGLGGSEHRLPPELVAVGGSWWLS